MLLGRVAAVADRPDHQARRRARCRRRRTRRRRLVIMVRQSTFTVPQRVTVEVGRVEQRRQVLGIEAQRLDHQVGLEREVGCRRSPAASAGRWRRAAPRRMRAARTPVTTVVLAEEGLGRGQPDELDAFLLGVASPRAASPACWPGRGGRGTSPTCAPWRTAVRTQSMAVSPPPITTTCLPSASSAPPSKSGTASPRPLRLRGGEIVERRDDAAEADAGRRRCRAPCRRRWRSAPRRGAARSSASVASRPTSQFEMEVRPAARPAASPRRSTTSFSSLKLGMP